MNKTFQVINNFIKDIYNVEFIKEELDKKFEDLDDITELRKAHEAIVNIINSQRKPSSDKLLNDIYPLLDISIQWDKLKISDKITAEFLQHCKDKTRTHKEFYGTIFEIDIASRFLFACRDPHDIDICFPEDRIKKDGIKIIDIIINKNLGIECKSERYTDDLKTERLVEEIQEKSEKFKPEFLCELGVNLDIKILVFDITRNEYRKPNFIRYLKNLQVPEELDGIVFTWKEKTEYEGRDLITIKYKTIGNIPENLFPAYQFMRFKSGAYALRNYMEPEPQWAEPGQEESYVEWVLADHGGKLFRSELLRLTGRKPDDLDAELKRLELNRKIMIREGNIRWRNSQKDLIILVSRKH